MIAALGYCADVALAASYAIAVRTGWQRPFHWANALGAIPLVLAEARGHVWPAVITSGMFGVLGWVGVLRGSK